MFYDCRNMSFGAVDKIEYPKDLCAKGMYANMPLDRFERYDGVMDSLFINPGDRRAELVPDAKTMLNPDTERPLAVLARQQQNSKDVYMNFEYPLPDPKYPPVTLTAAPTYPTQVAQPMKFNAKTLVSEPKDLPKSVMEPVGKIREGKSLAGAALMHGLREPATGFSLGPKGPKSKPSRTLNQTVEEAAPVAEPQAQTMKEAPAKPNLQDVRNKRIEKAQALLDGTIEKKPGKSAGVSAQNRGDIDLA